MKAILVTLFLALFLQAKSNEKMNILLFCVDDLRPELNCYGVDYIKSPNIDAIASNGMLFNNHYVQAPTCGASRYTLLTGLYGGFGNYALFTRAKKLLKDSKSVNPSMPAWFKKHGYTTVSVGKVSHHPGGLGGRNWDDKSNLEMPNSWDRHLMPSGKWQHPRGIMHGLANGEIRGNAGKMSLIQAVEGPDDNYPDGLIANEALNQLKILNKDSKPFFLAVGIIRPHLPFGAPTKYLEPYKNLELPPTPYPKKPTGKTTYHKSGEFMEYNRDYKGKKRVDPNVDEDYAMEVRRHYAACITYADALIGQVMAQLKASGADKNTIVLVWGDHGWHLGEHGIWGKHALFEESLRSPLIISHPDAKNAGKKTNAIVETIDIFPTLCELAKLPKPDFIHGKSLSGIIDAPESKGHVAISYGKNAFTIRTNRYRLIAHQNSYYELYDHQSKEKETKNLADAKPEVVSELKKQLDERLKLFKK